MRVLYFAVLCLLFCCGQVIADDKNSTQEQLKNRLDAVFAVLQKEELNKSEKNHEINEIVTPMFDFRLMAKLSLGKKYWPGLSIEEKDRFTQFLIKHLKTSYLEKFTLYTDEKVIYEPPVQLKKKIHIPTYLVSKDRKVSMLYKFYNYGNTWKIYDLEIQGVSIIRSYRAQFSKILESGTIDDLLLKLENSDKG